MVESHNNQDFEDKIILGFLQKPQNSLITTAPYTPSKIGGKPAWIVPKNAQIDERCQYCGYYKQFLMQLYANSTDPSLQDYHRTLYVFTCLSSQCINTQRAVQVYRTVMKNNNEFGIEFADEDLFDEVQNSYQQQLIDRGLINIDDEDDQEEESKQGKDTKDIKIEYKEHMIVNEPEQPDITQFYLKESKRIKNKQPKTKQTNLQDDADNDLEGDEEEDLLEEEFLRYQANSNKDKRQIDKLVKKTLKGQDSDDESGDQGNDDEKIDEVEMQELEKLIKNNHTNYQQISDHYKLFEVVCKADPEQVLRFVNNRENAPVEPLWMSEKNIIDPSKILPCERCGQPRSFEFQLMPQLFDYIKELLLVDWNTLVFYTCHNPKCFPDYQNGEFLVKEFSYIQFSDDFDKVQYGDDKQIERQRQQKREQELKEQKEQQTVEQQQQQVTQQDNEEVKENKKKEKKKDTKQEDQQNYRDQVNQEVQNQLQDLMNDLKF